MTWPRNINDMKARHQGNHLTSSSPSKVALRPFCWLVVGAHMHIHMASTTLSGILFPPFPVALNDTKTVGVACNAHAMLTLDIGPFLLCCSLGCYHIVCKAASLFWTSILQDEKRLYIVLEYVCGGELFSHLRKAGKFPNDVAKFYAAEIILAFEYLHSLDILYRDLKPENLLLDTAGHVRITDFGFAKKVLAYRSKTVCGFLCDLSPICPRCVAVVRRPFLKTDAKRR